MEFRVLGPVEVRVEGRLVDVGHARQRGVLTVLLLEANRPVSADQLAERVWGEGRLPARPRDTVRTYVSLLRRALAGVGDAALQRQSGGYLISVDERLVDAHAFRALTERARAAGRDDEAVGLFERALALWRGEPLDTLDTPWLTHARATLDEERRAAERDLTDLQLRLGRHGALLGRLSAWAEQEPLDERLTGQLMLALFRAGRQADALRHYHRLREHLADELGTDPGEALRGLHQRILTDDPALAAPPPPPAAAPPVAAATTTPGAEAAVVPRQLPAGIPHFAGRAAELKALSALAERVGDPVGTVVISAIGGTAGIGKTALAIHWAHRHADRFPDGQLYVNLGGFDPAGAPVEPAAAVRGFLDALNVPPARIPADPRAQAALYRSLLAGRRMLVVLDNARDPEQVRPLLPGSPTCLALVTSRSRLTGLVALEGAYPLALDLLDADEARELLVRRLGADRVAAEPGAAEELIGLCARLPLALNIAAAAAAVQPGFPLAALTDRLRGARDRPAVLDSGDTAANLHAVFSWSYDALGAAAARVFRLFGVHPGPDITAPAAAGLTATGVGQARAALDELTAAHLLAEHRPGRYTCHDLLRAYAAERARGHDTERERRAALHRVLDHYLHTAYAAERLLYPGRDVITLGPARDGAAPEEIADDRRAWAWMEAERPVLLAAVEHAAAHGFDTHAWQLPWALVTFLDRRGYWQDYAATQRTALAAVERLGDLAGQARAHRTIARAQVRLGSYPDVHTHLGHALELSSRLGDHTGEAYTHRVLAWVLDQQGDYRAALDHVLRALDLFRTADDRNAQAQTVNAVGWYHSLLGDHRNALVYCRQALRLHREIGDEHGTAGVWDSLGHAHHHLGEHQEAIACYRRALDIFTRVGDRYEQADTLVRLGDAHHATGDHAATHAAWRRALAILDDVHHPSADQVRAKLDAVAARGAPR